MIIKVKRAAALLLLLCISAFAEEGTKTYELGRGLQIGSTPLYLGGYITSFYKQNNDGTSTISHDDTAVMLYGDINEKLSLMAEYEIADTYHKTYGANESEFKNSTFRPERAYLNYTINEYATLRVGKFPSFVGVWNQTPIPVLRDTLSSPRVTKEIFPKFTTGAAVYGSLPFDEDSTYGIFGQGNRDLDSTYNNIETDVFYGAHIEKRIGRLKVGASAGAFRDRANSETVQYVGASFEYKHSNLKAIGEAVACNDEIAASEKHAIKKGYYLQLAYKIFDKNHLIGRTEYLDDPLKHSSSSVNTIGWSYRPHPSVSVKAEKQFDSRNKAGNASVSLAILF